MTVKLLSIIFILVLSSAQCLKGQTIVDIPDIGSRPEVLQEVFNLHFPDLHVKKIHGQQYTNLYPSVREHQFYKSSFPFQGIVYTADDTIYYFHLLYDIHRDKLIAYHKAARALIELEEEFIRSFDLFENEGHNEFKFTKPEQEKKDAWIPGTGFYQVLFASCELDLLKKHYKTLSEYLEGSKYQVRFVLHERLIMRKDNLYFTVRTRKDILRHFPGAKNDLKRYLQKNRIRLKYANDQELSHMAEFLVKVQPD